MTIDGGVAWAALQALLAGVGSGTALLPLMGRLPITGDQVANSPIRQHILDVVRSNPGVPLATLEARIPVGWGALYHHLHKLESGGFIEFVATGRRRLIFPKGEVSDACARAKETLRSGNARSVAEWVLRHPHCSVRDLIQGVDGSPRVVYYHVRRLLEAGLIHSTSPTRHFDLIPDGMLESYLLSMDPPEGGAAEASNTDFSSDEPNL